MPSVECGPAKAGMISITITSDDQQSLTIQLLAQHAGTISTALLVAAKRATHGAKLNHPPGGKSLTGVHGLVPSSIGLAEHPTSGEQCLILNAGVARLAVALGVKQARRLGSALMAASANHKAERLQ